MQWPAKADQFWLVKFRACQAQSISISTALPASATPLRTTMWESWAPFTKDWKPLSLTWQGLQWRIRSSWHAYTLGLHTSAQLEPQKSSDWWHSNVSVKHLLSEIPNLRKAGPSGKPNFRLICGQKDLQHQNWRSLDCNSYGKQTSASGPWVTDKKHQVFTQFTQHRNSFAARIPPAREGRAQ